MDINDQLQSIVAGLIGNLKTNLEQELQDKISKEVVAKVANTELDSIISKQIEAELARRLEKFNFADTSKAHLTKLTADITKEIGDNIGEQARNQVTSEVARRLALIDLGQQVDELVKSKLESIVKLNKFPERSIPHTSIQFDKFTISGNVVKGGIISNFSSTGIKT